MSDIDFFNGERGFVGTTFVNAGRESGFRFGGWGAASGASGGGELGGWEERTSTVSSGSLKVGMVGLTLVNAGWLLGLSLGTGSGAVGGFGATVFEKARSESGFAFDVVGSTAAIGDFGGGGLVG